MLFADADGASRFSDLDHLEQKVSDKGDYSIVVGSRAHLEERAVAEVSQCVEFWYSASILFNLSGTVSAQYYALRDVLFAEIHVSNSFDEGLPRSCVLLWRDRYKRHPVRI